MRIRLLLTFVIFGAASLSGVSSRAASPATCETIFSGAPPPTKLTLINENAHFFDVDASLLDEGSLHRLGDELKPKPYFGRPAPEGLRAYLFDVGFREEVDVVAALTYVRLGARLKRGEEEVKIRIELPFVDLEPRAATAQALTDLFNHFDLLRRPATLTREMNLLRLRLLRLAEPDAGLILRPAFVRSAIKLLDQALDLRAPLRGRSTYLGKRFAAYFRARQMLTHAWLAFSQDERRAMARDVLHRAPKSSLANLNADEVIEQATRGAHLFGRPWFFTVDAPKYYATMLWFEILANRGARAGAGGLFLSQPFVGDLSPEQLARYDQRELPAAPEPTDDQEKTDGSLQNTVTDANPPTPDISDTPLTY